MTAEVKKPIVSIIMGSNSDWPTMKRAAAVLEEFGIPYEKKIVSAHRTPARCHEFVESLISRGIKVVIAGAGGAAHLAGVVAASFSLPVVGVPMKTSSLGGQDSLLSIVQMPSGVPVGTMAIGDAGATNAGVYAAEILATSDETLLEMVTAYKARLAAEVPTEPFDTEPSKK